MRVNNGEYYFFRKNLQGDITNITDNVGNIIAGYRYDAWGKILETTGNTTIANLNPFRYRGYFYDTETGWYLLSTRYYDPEIGRFINADDVAYLDPESLNGLNLYAYCRNNAVMYSDPTGCLPQWLGWLLTGTILAGLVLATVLTFGAAAPITGMAATMVV